jgi:hypothetical protein
MKHMNEKHPRWYELARDLWKSIRDCVSEKENTNIASTTAKIKLIGNGKTLEKKLLLSMTVKDLMSMCAKLLKIEVIRQRLVYQYEGCSPYVLDVELR